MMATFRAFCLIAGLVVLAAAAHVTVAHAGGYFDTGGRLEPHAVLTLAIALGVAVGSLAIGVAWAHRRIAIALWIALALLAGEAFGLLRTAERIVDGRENARAPIEAAAQARKSARERVSAAERTLAALSTTKRLQDALAAEKQVSATVAADAAKRGCRENCRQLLQAQADRAAAEVAAARADLKAQRQKLETELATTRAALAAIPAPRSASPLADRLGLEPWALDVLAAILGSLGANGLGAALVAFGGHAPHTPQPRRPLPRKAEPVIDEIAPEPIAPRAIVPQPPAPRLIASTERPVLLPLRFLADTLQPVPGQRVEIAELLAAYDATCRARGMRPASADDFMAAVHETIEGCHIRVQTVGSLVFLEGVALAAVLPAKQGALQ